MEAVAGELVRRDIVPDVAGLCALGQQVSDQVIEVVLGSHDVLASMQECDELGGVLLVRNKRERLEHSFKPLASVATLVPELCKMLDKVVALATVLRH